jgi:4-amino-4-deoxy-L-arabinose transferase-like glycosyltransferase
MQRDTLLSAADRAAQHRGVRSVGTSLLFALGALILLRMLSLGLYPLMDHTEARYADIAQRMLKANDWITPWIGDKVPFWGKPPLSFWATRLSFEALGVNEFAARFPHFVLGVLVAWTIWSHVRRSSARAAWHSVALLSGSALFLVASGAVMTDMALTLGTSLVMVGFWRSFNAQASDRTAARLLAIGAIIGLLAKGPVSVVLWGLPLALWASLTGNVGAAWRRVAWLRGGCLVTVAAVPWYLLAERATPGFLHYFIIGEHWHRFTEPGWSGDLYGGAHQVPRGTIWLYALAAILPWPFLAPFALLPAARAGRTTNPLAKSERIYLWAWTLAPCLIFTLAANIIWTYVLPGLPALAVLAGYWTSARQDQIRTDRSLAFGLSLTALGVVGLIAVAQLSTRLDANSTKALISEYRALASDEPLYFFGHVPFSGSFYSADKARGIASLQDVPPGRRAYIILEQSAWNALSPDQLARVQFKARRGGRVLAEVHPGPS